jgi:O-antigen ligase
MLSGIASYPVGIPWLVLALLGYAALLWRRLRLWLFIVPALLPVLDLSPFTGRLLLDEFDLLVLMTLAVGYWQVHRIHPQPWPHHGFPAALILLWISWGVAMMHGLWPLLEGEGHFSASSHSPLETWQVGKGLLWALLLVPLLRRTLWVNEEGAQSRFLQGVVAGLTVVTLVVFWERHVFVGLGDFENVFRVTGTFANMHTGGAYIEAFIAFAFPALAVGVLTQQNGWLKLVSLIAVALTSYAMLVTFSRGGYAGLVAGLMVVAWGMLWSGRGLLRHRGLAFAGLVVVAIAVAVPVLSGGFAQYRLTLAAEDLAFRQNRWIQALDLMDSGVTTILTGMGFGQYPTRYLFGADIDKLPGTFSVLRDGDNPYLRLGAGETVFLDQWVKVGPGEQYTLSARVRRPQGEGSLNIPLCEKALLYSFECSWQRLDPPMPGEGWHTVTVTVDAGKLGRGGNWPHRPVKLSLHNSGTHSPVDVDDVSFKTADGREWLANGDFSDGVNRWLFVTDQDVAWHIHQQWVELYFAQGVLGVLAVGVLLFSVTVVLWPAVLAGSPYATAFAGALAAFLTVGLLGSTVDTARLSLLFYLGAFCGGLLQPLCNKQPVS